MDTSFIQGAYFVKLDTAGAMIWSKLFEDSTKYSTVQSVINTSDGGFAAAATISSRTLINADNYYFLKFNADESNCGMSRAYGYDSSNGTMISRTRSQLLQPHFHPQLRKLLRKTI